MRSLRFSVHGVMIVLLATLLALAPFVHGHRGGAQQGDAHLHFAHAAAGPIHVEPDTSDVVGVDLAFSGSREHAAVQALIHLPDLAPAPKMVPLRPVRRVSVPPTVVARARLHACGLPPPAAAPPLTA